MGMKIVDEPNYGVYLWKCANGQYAGDGEGYMLIQSMRGDLAKVAALEKAARAYDCYEGGHAEFRPGVRPVSSEEAEEQLNRLKWGLVPDPLDIQAMKEEEYFRANGR